MLAVLLAVVLVTAMVISQTEQKVRETYSRLAEEEFDEQADRFLEMRRSRLEAIASSVERLAHLPEVRRLFVENDFGDEALENIEPLTERRRRSQERSSEPDDGRNSQEEGGAPPSRLLLLVDANGKVHPIGERPFTIPEAARAPLRKLGNPQGLRSRQVGYLVIPAVAASDATPAVPAQLVEVVVAPVFADADAPEGAAEGASPPLGAVVMGQIVDPSGIERRSMPVHDRPSAGGVERNAPAGGILGGTRRRLYAGILADEVLFAGTLPAGVKAEVEQLLAERLRRTVVKGADGADFDDELSVDSEARAATATRANGDDGHSHYRVFCDLLSSGGALPPTYQVVLIPMSQLHADLLSLRLQGTGIGLAAALLGLLLSWIFSRRLSRPIRDLAQATEQLRGGNFHVRVPVRSNDEFGQLAESFNEMAGHLETKEQIRDLLGKVSDEAVAQALIEGQLELGGETRTASVLFCDIRGFTAMTESMNPGDVIALLNEHMTAMTEVVYQHNGVIDKFVGDEIMVIFGAPKSYPDDAGNAARCALKMVERRAELSAETGREIHVGIGVATGDVVVGCMGSSDRLNYTVIGERVNRAARLCACAGGGEVIVDEQTWAEIAGRAEGDERLSFKPRGYAQDIRAFRLDSMADDRSEALSVSSD